MIRSVLRLCRLAAAAAMVFTVSAQGAEIGTLAGSGGAKALELTGLIAPGDDAKLAEILAATPHPASLALSSLGGNVQAALAIGTLVRHEGLRTTVPARGICASACGLVWLAGTPRAMGQDAHVGLHAAYLRRNGVSLETGAANALIGAYLSRLGFDDRAIVYLTSAAPEEMTWILAADRQRYGIAFDSDAPAVTATMAAGNDHVMTHPMALAGAIASAAAAVVDSLLGRSAPTDAAAR